MHHGNGTEEIIRERGEGKILFASSFEHGSKYSGDGVLRLGVDGICRIPIPKQSNYDKIRGIYHQMVIPRVVDWNPEIIFISAGFDMHEHDPLTQLRMSSRDYYSLTRLICDVADKVCGGRVISVLEGGYEIKALEESVRHHLRALKPKNEIE
jgi:acetoin utilization deacetylase AcuC-like enzyme